MARVFVTAVLAGILMLAGCSDTKTIADESGTESARPEEKGPGGKADGTGRPVSKKAADESDGPKVPYLPALETIEDPGTVDRLLGTFPVDDSRNYQHAWIEYAGKGRRMAQVARNLEGEAQVPILQSASDADIYYSGVVVCTDFLANLAPSDSEEWLVGYYEDLVPAGATDDETQYVGAVIVAAVNVLCPQAKPILDDADYLVSTPVMLRAVLGVSESQLSDDQANTFANWICNELDRGTTESRLSVTIAEEYDYPDDRTEALVSRVNALLCG